MTSTYTNGNFNLMSNYRRAYIPGGTYCFTVVTHKRTPILCSEKAIQRLKTAFHYTQEKYPFKLEALVVMPDHLHCIWQLPQNDSDFSKRWNTLKRYFSLGIESDSNHRREKQVWQRRFWEHLVRDEKDLERCLDYIYYNPVKHGYVQKPIEWRYSTFKRDVEKGLYDKEWGSIVEPRHIAELDFE
jgi:putative transposase